MTDLVDSNATLANVKTFEHRTPVLSSENDIRAVKSLSKYFEIRHDCPFALNKYENDTEKTGFCSTTADYLLCFPSVRANQTLYAKCPYKAGIPLADTKASKYCNENGIWEATNYLDCIKSLVSHLYSTDCYATNKSILNSNSTVSYVETIECEDIGSNDIVLQIVADLYLVGFILTFLVVGTAIGIFASVRSLRCVRNMIHSNLLFTFFIKSVTFIPFWFFVIRNYDDIIAKTSHPLCVIFQITWNYSLLASFFWMMIEGIYLINVIVAAYSSNQIRLWWYLLVGWVWKKVVKSFFTFKGLPILPIIPYTIITVTTSNSTCNWIKPEYNSFIELFIDVPIYLVLMVNFVLLITILYFIIAKLKENNDALKCRYNQYKKLIRATIVLFPLLGLTFALFIWQPTDPKTLASKIYFYVNIFFQTTQGIWASVIYCFMNDEVQTALKNKFRNWKSTRDVEMSLYTILSRTKSKTFRHSTRSNSLPCARLKSNQANIDQSTSLTPMLPQIDKHDAVSRQIQSENA